MRSSLIVILALLLIAGADARYSPGLEIAEGENITLDGGYLKEASVLMAAGKNITGSGGFITNVSTDYYITPECFGAVGDNSTNDTGALQDAIDYAHANHVYVMLGPTMYNHTGLQLYPESSIKGVNGDDVWQTGGYASALRYTGSGVALNLSNSTGAYNYKIRLADFAIIGPGWGHPDSRVGTGLHLHNVSEFHFDRITIKGFAKGIYGDEMSIGTIRDSDVCENLVAFDSMQSHAILFSGCNMYANDVIYKITASWDLALICNQHELFDVGIYANSSESGDVVINNMILIGNAINNEAVYFIGDFLTNPPMGHVPWNSHWIEITDGGDYHVADQNVVVYGINMMFNELRMYKTDEFIEFDLQDVADHGSSIKGSDIMNLYQYANTSVYKTVNSPYTQMSWFGSRYPDISSIHTGSQPVAYGLSMPGWTGVQVEGGITLPLSQVNNAGNIWYDPSAKKLKFYTGSRVETVTSF